MPDSSSEKAGQLAFRDRLLPWIAGLVGALLFTHPLWRAPASTILDRSFWWDTLVNVDDLIELHRSFARGPGGANFRDWLYGGHFFYPQPRPLLTSELMPLAAVVSWPFAAWPVLAHNLLLTTALVLNCAAAASFARTLGARPLSATVAAVGFAFCSYVHDVSSRLQLMFLFPLLWGLAAAVRWGRNGQVREAWIIAATLATQALLCLYYTTFFLIAVPMAGLITRVSQTRRPEWKLVRVAVPFLIFLPPVLLLLWPYATLRTELGMTHPVQEVVQQSGELWTFKAADPSLLANHWFKDRTRWDTAHFPGLIIMAATVCGLVIWLARRPGSRLVTLALAIMAVLPVFAGQYWLMILLWTAGLGVLIFRARQGKERPELPVIAGLLLVGFFIFEGPQPSLLDKHVGWSPYAWLFHHVSIIQGIRMVRRAVLLIQLALCGVAALALSRFERARHGRIVLGLTLLAVMAEDAPWFLHARAVPTTCEDPAMLALRQHGAEVIGDVSPKGLREEPFARVRHQATLCGVRTTEGFSGLWPILANRATDAVNLLPDPAAHAWLWDAGVRHVEVHNGKPDWFRRRMSELREISEETEEWNSVALIALKSPHAPSFDPPEHIAGPRVPIRSVECTRPQDCERLIDGSEDARWTSETNINGGETFTLHFDEANVGGIEWHDFDFANDLPRGLRIERMTQQGTWELWREIVSLSPMRLGRSAVDVSLGIALPPMRTTALRLTQTGKSGRFWLSATELQVVQAQGPL